MSAAIIAALALSAAPGAPPGPPGQSVEDLRKDAARKLAKAVVSQMAVLAIEFEVMGKSAHPPNAGDPIAAVSRSLPGQVRVLQALVGEERSADDSAFRAVRRAALVIDMLSWPLTDRERFEKVEAEFTEPQWKRIRETILEAETPDPRGLAELVRDHLGKGRAAASRLEDALGK